METMKAVRIHNYGGVEVLKYETAEIPKIQDDEVLVKIHAASVNPVDWKIREGYRRDRMPHQLPLILGWDLSGEIAATGKKANQFKKGDLVYSRPDIARNGAYAEFIAVKADEVALKPQSLDHVHAAAIPLAALTAWQALFDAAHLAKGQKVLIHAAAGGVGHYAVQLAKWKGAYVIGTASGKNKQFLLDSGCDEAIDYTTTDFAKNLHDLDVVFDTIGGETQLRSWPLLKKGGTLVTIVPGTENLEETAKHYNVHAQFVFVAPNAQQLTKIAELADQKIIVPEIAAIFPLADAAKAQQLSQAGHTRGKIILKIT